MQVLNEKFGAELMKLFASASRPVDELIFISIDALGADIRVRNGSEFMVERISFNTKVHNMAEAVGAMQSLITISNASLGGAKQ